MVGQKYVEAARLAQLTPLLVPPMREHECQALLAMADGLLLTGSPSNVDPAHFGQDVRDPDLPLDRQRDAWTLPMIRMAVERGVPVLGICRGLQEFNVAMGGSLSQALHEEPGRQDHRADERLPVEQEYGPSHDAWIEPGGLLDAVLAGLPAPARQGQCIRVNSLHGQGVDRLARGLRVEARSPDGVVEALSDPRAPFALCLQWHPEWLAAQNPVSQRLFAAFGQACKDHRARRIAKAR